MAESKYTPERVERIIKAVKDGLPFFAGANVHIRVPFENHTAKHPHTARTIAQLFCSDTKTQPENTRS